MTENEKSESRDLGSTIRIVDANANRATEGLRVVEEYLRFHQQDKLLSKTCKKLRHQVSRTVAQLVSPQDRVACRSTETDVGTQVRVDSEYVRQDPWGIVLANMKRATEALRVLEEYAKLLSADAAKEFESLRYQTYTLEKSIGHLVRAEQSIDRALLYVLIDGSHGYGDAFRSRVELLLKSEVDVIRIRAKDAEDRDVVDCARGINNLCKSAGKLFVVNDRPDIAQVIGSGALHLGQTEMRVADARAIVGPDTLIGVSTHTLLQAEQAVRDGADYIGVGPVFASKTKQFANHVGLEFIEAVAQNIELPFFAIGGIDEIRLPEVIAAGAKRVAVSHAVWQAADPIEAAQRIRDQLVRPKT